MVYQFFEQDKNMKKIVLLSAFGLLFLTGCETIGGGVIVDTSYGYTPAPPAHAPAYGRRMQRRYYYYPEAEFYFDIGRNMYFYLDSGSRWISSPRLPHRLRRHLSSSYVEIEMDDDRPYRRHKFYRNKYRGYRNKAGHGGGRGLLNDGTRQYNNDRQYLNNNGNKHQYRDNRAKNKHRNRDNKYRNKHEYRDNGNVMRNNKKKHNRMENDDDDDRMKNRRHDRY